MRDTSNGKVTAIWLVSMILVACQSPKPINGNDLSPESMISEEDRLCREPQPILGYEFADSRPKKNRKITTQMKPIVLFRTICRKADGTLEVRDRTELEIRSSTGI